MIKKRHSLSTLREIMATLRGPGGCPWDQEQTHETLIRFLLEEAYEVIDAIHSKEADALSDELGDLLLQIVFHAEIAREDGQFDMDDVLDSICEKMIRRHPHVFGETEATSVKEVLQNWEAIKEQEHAGNRRSSLMDGVPNSFPALLRAEKTQAKAAKVGFDWDNAKGALEKIGEEAEELVQAIASEVSANTHEELGDLLFSIVNVCRHLQINPEVALNQTTDKFAARFRYIEERAKQQGRALDTMSLQEMDALWDEAKSHRRKTPQP